MPLLDLIAEREAAAAAAAETLREQIAKLSHQLALVETELAEFAITRKTLTRLTEAAEATATVGATIASTAYQKILAVFATAADGMRARDVCLALGLGITAKDTEGNARLAQTPRRPSDPHRGRAGPVHARPDDHPHSPTSRTPTSAPNRKWT